MLTGQMFDTSTLKLTFADEFDSLSSSPFGSTGIWKTSYAWGNRTLGSNGEQQYYSDSSVGIDPFSVVNGVLDITAAPGANPLGLPYVSGAITTETTFSQLYGYFEIRAELPAGQGLWPAFWLLPDDLSWPPELDIFEVLGHDPTTLYFSTHSTVQPTEGTTLTVADVSKGFHTYGSMWGPDTVAMYIDGVQVASMATPADLNKEMYMLVNLAVGGYWPGLPDATTQFPAHMLIDYVHAYAYPGTAGGVLTVTDPSENDGPDNHFPDITVPGTLLSAAGVTVAFAGVSVTDTWPGGSFTVTVSDGGGLLHTDAVSLVHGSGQTATFLTLVGNLDRINAALATLTYKSDGGADWIWVSVVDPSGLQSFGATIAAPASAPSGDGTPGVLTPATFSIEAGHTKSIPDIYIADTDLSGIFTIIVSGATGLLRTSANTTAAEHGEGTSSLTLTGSIRAVNDELATLTYQADGHLGTVWLWVSATDNTGAQGVSPILVSVTPELPNEAPSVTAPANVTIAAGAMEAITGIRVTDTDPDGIFTVVVSGDTGLLRTGASTSVVEHGQGTNALTLTGSIAGINAELATLSYEAGSNPGTVWLWVSANDDRGAQGVSPIVVSVTPKPTNEAPSITAPAGVTVEAGVYAAVPGIHVTDDDTTGDYTVVISDAKGLLSTGAVTGVSASGKGTTELTLGGDLAHVNAALATLMREAEAAGGTEWLWVSATDPHGARSFEPIVITAQDIVFA